MFLSVVMAVYNGEEYLQEAIDSVLNQSFKDFEFIIVNDASTDGTYKILENITDKRVKVIHSNRNCGGAASLKKGIAAAIGKWIAIHDADDISERYRFAEQIKFIKNNPGISGTGTLIKCIPGNGHVDAEQMRKDEEVNIRVDKDHIHDYRYWGNAFCHGSMMFSKEIYERAGGYNPQVKIAYDYDLWLRMQAVLPLQKVPQVLYYWRTVSTSLSRKNIKATREEVWGIILKHICKQQFDSLKREPNFLIIGSKENCENFQLWEMTVSGFQTNDHFLSDEKSTPSKVIKLFDKQNIDAAVIIGDQYSMRILNDLQRKGMELNKNIIIIH